MNKLNWGILGTGAIARKFASALTTTLSARGVAVASRTQAKADLFGEELGWSKRYGSYEALLNDPEVQAVYIATPHSEHAEWAIKAAEAKKHLLVEKPIGINEPQAMAIVDAARENGVFLMEAFMYRCHPQIARALELIRSGTIGNVRLIQASFGFQARVGSEHRLLSPELGGGAILDVGCYPVSMARLVAGVALGRDFAEPLEVKGAHGPGPTGVDGWAIADLKFDGSIVAQLATGILLELENVVRIFGSEGRMTLPRPWGTGTKEGRIVVERRGEPSKEIDVPNHRTAYSLEAEMVAECIEQRQAPTPAMTWDDTLGNMRCLDRWRRAVSLAYPSEKLEGFPLPLHKRALRVRQQPPIPQVSVSGLEMPVSRLVMGASADVALAPVMWDAFFERGGNAFDTSYWYGQTDKVLGQWIKSRGVRKQCVIVAKGAHTPGCYPEELSRQLLASLESLQTDCAEVYFMHRDNPEIPVGEFVDVLNQHVNAGRIKMFGGSNWTLARLQEAIDYAKGKGLLPFSALSNNLSLARMVNPVWNGCIAASDPESRAWLEKTQTPLFSWSSQARGFFIRGDSDDRTDRELANAWYSDDNFERLRRARELGARYGVTANNIALSYVLCQPFPTFCLIGPQSLEEIRTTLPALGLTLEPNLRCWLNLERDMA